MEMYSVSFYDNVTTDDCTGFGWNFVNLTEDKIHSFLHPLINRILTLYLHPLVAIFGILGNLAFMFIVWKVPYMRNSTNIILLNLSVADLLFLLVGTGVKLINITISPVSGDSFFYQCFLIIPLVNVVTFASLLLVSLISVERYIAVCKPHQYLKMTSRRRTLTYISSVWGFSFALAILLLPSSIDFVTFCVAWPDAPIYEKFPTKVGFCDSRDGFWASVNECVQIFPFFIALILNIFCFVKIMFRLCGRMMLSPTYWQTQQNHTIQRQNSSVNAATRMLLINGIAFFALTTPFHLTSAVQFIESVSLTWSCDCQEVKNISVLLLYVNSSVNPFIYGLTNRTYRRAYYSVFGGSPQSSHKSWSTMTTTDNNKRSTNL
ncbi:Neuromedin-U receptor 2 [Holothuria leucospilota]|uniref:Neuromedin-U receptor 2 n=1 Tax=Holothuria leucospilota TaxID=206669 RepID=A0A9Q1C386_HOLLE|nr:Neuromedin-U receptor 2 [Holothuria leucospilota]